MTVFLNASTGTPSGVIAEIKSHSEFVTVSTQLDTGGLQSIVLHFAETVICKVNTSAHVV